jgi:hypothetical protein
MPKHQIMKIHCDGFAQGIVGQHLGRHALAHAPRNTVEVVPSCPRMYRGYTTHAQVTSHNCTTNVYNALLGNRAVNIPSQHYRRRGVFCGGVQSAYNRSEFRS